MDNKFTFILFNLIDDICTHLDLISIIHIFYIYPELLYNYKNKKFIEYLLNELTDNELMIFTDILSNFDNYFISGGFISKFADRTLRYTDIDIYVYGNPDEFSKYVNIFNKYLSKNNTLCLEDIKIRGNKYIETHLINFKVIDIPNTKLQFIYIPDIYEYYRKYDLYSFEELIIHTLYNFDLQICQCAIDKNNRFIKIYSCSKNYVDGSINVKRRAIKYYKRRNKKIWNTLY